MRKTYLYAGLLTFGLAATMFDGYSKLAAPPAGSTGAPGESKCSASGCHSTDASSADVTFTVNGQSNFGWNSNSVHNIKLTVASSGMTTCGFQAIALAKSNNAQAGSFIQINNDTRTFLTTQQSTQKKYIGHSSEGVACATTGQQEFSWRWETPSTSVGKVSFYVAINEANGDGTSDGDKTAYKEFQLNERVGIKQEEENVYKYSVYPAMVQEVVNISYYNPKNQSVSLQLVDLKGQVVYTFSNQSQAEGQVNARYAMPSVAAGMYLVKLTNSQDCVVQKIVVY
jgi:hypothetical protein